MPMNKLIFEKHLTVIQEGDSAVVKLPQSDDFTSTAIIRFFRGRKALIPAENKWGKNRGLDEWFRIPARTLTEVEQMFCFAGFFSGISAELKRNGRCITFTFKRRK